MASIVEMLLTKQMIPAYIAFIAIILGIISCSSNAWSVYPTTNATATGIFCYTNGTVCQGPTIGERGATLAFMLFGIVLLITSISLVAMAMRKDSEKFFKVSIHVTDAAVVCYVIGLAIFLHGSLTTIDVGWSYWVGISTFAVALTSSIIARLLAIFFK